jgi:hypothetical protein
MRQVLLLLVLLSGPVLADVYKIVTDTGEVIYSDTPAPGAERINLPELPTYTPPPAPRAVPRPAEPQVSSLYNSMKFSEPTEDATVRNNEGMVKISLVLDPPLIIREGHKIQYYLDDEPHGIPVQTTSINFSNIDRGTHRVTADVIDKNAQPLIRADAVTFHLHRESVQHPEPAPGKGAPTIPAFPTIPGIPTTPPKPAPLPGKNP